MEHRSKPFLAAVLGLTIISLGCSPAKGACVRGTGITRSCGNDFTSASCGLIGGNTFYENLTCADVGFTSSNRVIQGNSNSP